MLCTRLESHRLPTVLSFESLLHFICVLFPSKFCTDLSVQTFRTVNWGNT
jgi:hypothetical protein